VALLWVMAPRKSLTMALMCAFMLAKAGKLVKDLKTPRLFTQKRMAVEPSWLIIVMKIMVRVSHSLEIKGLIRNC